MTDTAPTVPSYTSTKLYVFEFLKKPKQVYLFITNAPFMTLTQMTKLFKCYDYMIMAIANTLKIPINPAYSEIPLACIITRLKVVPPDAIIKHTSKGTVVILPGNKKYARIVHHFSGGTRDTRIASKSNVTDLPAHLQTKVWYGTTES